MDYLKEYETLLTSLESLKSVIDELPGKYQAFSNKYDKASTGKHHGLKKPLEDEIKKVKKKKDLYKIPGSSFETLSFVEDARIWINKANEHIELLESLALKEYSLALFFFENPIKGEGGNTGIGKALLRITDGENCELYKHDFSFEGGFSRYKGKFKTSVHKYGPCVYTFNTDCVGEKTIDITGRELNGKDEEPKVAMYTQYDGMRIHGGKMISYFLGQSLSAEQGIHLLNKRYEDRKNVVSEILAVRSINYLCVTEFENQRVSYNQPIASQKAITFDTPTVFLSTDFELGEHYDGFLWGEVSPYSQTLDIFNSVEDRLLFKEDKSGSKKDWHYFRRRDGIAGSFMKALSKADYLVYISFDTNRLAYASFFIGMALNLTKNVLFIHKKDSLPDYMNKLIEEFDARHHLIEKATVFEVKDYEDLEKDQRKIEDRIVDFILQNT